MGVATLEQMLFPQACGEVGHSCCMRISSVCGRGGRARPRAGAAVATQAPDCRAGEASAHGPLPLPPSWIWASWWLTKLRSSEVLGVRPLHVTPL